MSQLKIFQIIDLQLLIYNEYYDMLCSGQKPIVSTSP
jgi:hypothetical protein